MSPFVHSVCSAKGRRTSQQDRWLCVPELGLYAVADGMGGHESGDKASTAAMVALSRQAPGG